MARPAGGIEELDWAREMVKKAKTAEELRHAQSILLPLDLGLSLEQTAKAIGRSVSQTCKLRNRRRRESLGEVRPRLTKAELRNRATLSLKKEAAILDELLSGFESGGVVTIPTLLPAFEKAIGKSVAPSTLYRILARHGWRKLAPDTQHPKGDPIRRHAWKKNSPIS